MSRGSECQRPVVLGREGGMRTQQVFLKRSGRPLAQRQLGKLPFLGVYPTLAQTS